MEKREKIGKGNPPKATRFKPGNNANPNGRPRKYISSLKEQGYRLSEVNDCIQAMLSMTIEELGEVWRNPSATILEKTIAGAMRKGIETGKLDGIETLLTRAFGQPKQKHELMGEIKTINLSKLSPDKLNKLLEAKRILSE